MASCTTWTDIGVHSCKKSKLQNSKYSLPPFVPPVWEGCKDLCVPKCCKDLENNPGGWQPGCVGERMARGGKQHEGAFWLGLSGYYLNFEPC